VARPKKTNIRHVRVIAIKALGEAICDKRKHSVLIIPHES
jgi:hypothetical protein